MKILLCGLSGLGYSLVNSLLKLKCDLVVIDESPSMIKGLCEDYGINGYVGRPSSLQLLIKAGIQDFDLVLALSNDDELNMIVCYVCHQMFNVKTKIARIEYGACTQIVRMMGVDIAFLPYAEVAIYIMNNIVADFFRFQLSNSNIWIIESQRRLKFKEVLALTGNGECLFLGAARGGDLLRSVTQAEDGDYQFLPGDKLLFCVQDPGLKIDLPNNLRDIAAKPIRRNLVLIGADKVGKALVGYMGVGRFKAVIEKDKGLAQELANAFEGLEVICGDAMEKEVLLEAGIREGVEVVVVTEDDRENILVSLLVSELGAEVRVTLVNNNRFSSDLYQGLGLKHFLHPVSILEDKLLGYVTASHFCGMDKERGLLYLRVDSSARLQKANANKANILLLMRGQNITLPRESEKIAIGDELILYLEKGHLI